MFSAHQKNTATRILTTTTVKTHPNNVVTSYEKKISVLPKPQNINFSVLMPI